MANQNKLTSDGLTVGSGTITNFITNFGSVVNGNGEATLTVPSSRKNAPSSLSVGGSEVFCISTSGVSNTPIILPSSGSYAYAIRKASIRSSLDYASEDYVRKQVSGSIKILPVPTSGGTAILPNTSGSSGDYTAWGGGIIRLS